MLHLGKRVKSSSSDKLQAKRRSRNEEAAGASLRTTLCCRRVIERHSECISTAGQGAGRRINCSSAIMKAARCSSFMSLTFHSQIPRNERAGTSTKLDENVLNVCTFGLVFLDESMRRDDETTRCTPSMKIRQPRLGLVFCQESIVKILTIQLRPKAQTMCHFPLTNSRLVPR
ncbi:hypothetical protein HZH66_008937 [Vespula vulgaris]|uniref:Uncharacterized protein n=1 Tax=Vespula vulgaris TaxID=7454 RepID=A0A834JU93_VESVU|nr:hypothetical protein HZH66_008937 [Vespula vulgaris]